MQVKFHCLFRLQVTVSFLAVEFTTSHSSDQSGLFYKRATVFFRSKTCFRYSSVTLCQYIVSLKLISTNKSIDQSAIGLVNSN